MALTSGGGSGIPGLKLVAYGVFSNGVAMAGNFGVAAVTSNDFLNVTLNPNVAGGYVVYAESLGGSTEAEVSAKTSAGFYVKFAKADGTGYVMTNSVDCVIQVYK